MSKRNWYALVSVAAVLLAGGGYAAWRIVGSRGEFVISGIIEADDIHVGSKINGRVLKVVAQEGQVVKAGDVLALLEPDELNASLAEAQASLRQAEARYRALVSGYGKEEIDRSEAAVKQTRKELDRLVADSRQQGINRAKEDWLAAKARYENAEKSRQQMSSLIERQLIARRDYEDAKAKADEAEQKMKAAKERYDFELEETPNDNLIQASNRLAEAEAKVRQLQSGYRREEIAQAKAGVEMAEARADLLKTQLGETVIKAPLDSVVEALDLRPGDVVAAGKPIATLLQVNSLWVRAYLPEDKLGYIRPDLRVRVRADSFPDQTFPGTVRRVHRQAESPRRNAQSWQERVLPVFQTEVVVEDPDGILRPGMNADVVVSRR